MTEHTARPRPVDEPATTRDAPAGPTVKGRTLARLRRIEGQVRGLQRMVDEERPCADVLTQLSSVQEALRAVGRELVRSHLKDCATSTGRPADARADALYDELVDLMYKHIR